MRFPTYINCLHSIAHDACNTDARLPSFFFSHRYACPRCDSEGRISINAVIWAQTLGDSWKVCSKQMVMVSFLLTNCKLSDHINWTSWAKFAVIHTHAHIHTPDLTFRKSGWGYAMSVDWLVSSLLDYKDTIGSCCVNAATQICQKLNKIVLWS